MWNFVIMYRLKWVLKKLSHYRCADCAKHYHRWHLAEMLLGCRGWVIVIFVTQANNIEFHLFYEITILIILWKYIGYIIFIGSIVIFYFHLITLIMLICFLWTYVQLCHMQLHYIHIRFSHCCFKIVSRMTVAVFVIDRWQIDTDMPLHYFAEMFSYHWKKPSAIQEPYRCLIITNPGWPHTAPYCCSIVDRPL